MTLHITFEYRCDRCGAQDEPWQSDGEAMFAARRDGWQLDAKAGDLCASCWQAVMHGAD